MMHPNVRRIVASLPKHCEIIDILSFVSPVHVGLRHGWLFSLTRSDGRFHCPTLRYHVPRSWINPGENLLVLHEEIGGDPSKVSVLTRTGQEICAVISEADPAPVDSWKPNSEFMPNGPQVQLSCEAGWRITSIRFASFGNPQGSCGAFAPGACHSNVVSVIEQVCLLFLLLLFYQKKRIFDDWNRWS